MNNKTINLIFHISKVLFSKNISTKYMIKLNKVQNEIRVYFRDHRDCLRQPKQYVKSRPNHYNTYWLKGLCFIFQILASRTLQKEGILFIILILKIGSKVKPLQKSSNPLQSRSWEQTFSSVCLLQWRRGSWDHLNRKV